MRRVLSTYLLVEQRLTVAVLDRVLKSGIDEIELFCARQHLDYRDQAQVNEIRLWLNDSPLKIHSVHSPLFSDDVWGRSGPHSIISITEPSKAKRIAATDEIKRALELADRFPFRYLIQHIGLAGEEYEEAKADAAFNSLDELHVFGKQLGVDILLENTPNEFSTAQRLKTFVRRTHLPLHFCFDTGHAHLNGGVEREFELMKDRIRSTHVHDNNGQEDSHLFPSTAEEGTIDWTSTMELLRSCGDDTPLLLELREPEDTADPLAKAGEAFERLENL